MGKKHFTRDEANQLLPVIEKELIILQELKKDFDKKYQELKTIKQPYNQDSEANHDYIFTLECNMEFMEIEAQAHVNNIQNKGAQLKDIEQGLIDFPTVINDQDMLWCWKLGEKEITHYHSVYEGFSGRKKIGE